MFSKGLINKRGIGEEEEEAVNKVVSGINNLTGVKWRRVEE